MDARLAGIRSDPGRNRAAKPRRLRVSEGGGRGAILRRGQRGTAGNEDHEGDEKLREDGFHMNMTNRRCEGVFPAECYASYAT